MSVTKCGLEVVLRERLYRKVLEFVQANPNGSVRMSDIVRSVYNQDVVGQSMKMKLIYALRDRGWDRGADKSWGPKP